MYSLTFLKEEVQPFKYFIFYGYLGTFHSNFIDVTYLEK